MPRCVNCLLSRCWCIAGAHMVATSMFILLICLLNKRPVRWMLGYGHDSLSPCRRNFCNERIQIFQLVTWVGWRFSSRVRSTWRYWLAACQHGLPSSGPKPLVQRVRQATPDSLLNDTLTTKEISQTPDKILGTFYGASPLVDFHVYRHSYIAPAGCWQQHTAMLPRLHGTHACLWLLSEAPEYIVKPNSHANLARTECRPRFGGHSWQLTTPDGGGRKIHY